MSNVPEVVVTGIGATTPLGGDVASTWQALLAGKSGVKPLNPEWIEKWGIAVTFAAQLEVPAADVLTVQERRRMDPSAQFAMIAAREAWADANLDVGEAEGQVPAERLGTVIASGIGGVWTLLDSWDTMKEKGARRVLPLTVPMLMNNSPSANVSIFVGAKAGAHTPVSACASGAEAIGYGVEMIRSGRADVVVVGGTEAAIHPLPITAFAKMQALSTRNDDPQSASRPYDADRDGFVMGEGAAVLVLEREDFARARGAKLYAKLTGVGMSSDAYDIAPPDPTGEGQERAMRLALDDAGLSGEQIVHVNAHATSTPTGDGIEAAAIARTVGSQALVSATKSMTGHLLGGAGALETVFAILAIRDRLAPPTINVSNPEPDLPIKLVRDEPAALPEGKIAALNNAFGFGGHNVALVVESID